MIKALDALFEPVDLGPVRLPNRLAMAPMTRLFARDGIPDVRSVDYYVRRARAGIGLIISEGTPPPHPAAHFHRNVPGLEGEEALARWRAIANGVRAAGSHMLIQLWHAGLLRDTVECRYPETSSIGPSGVYPGTGVGPSGLFEKAATGRAMTQKDIDDTIELFAVAAVRCKDLGFSGIELHAGHGYLFDQFFWSETNLRNDRYGGGIAERTRFAIETIEEVRRRTGPEFLIGLRFSQFKPPLYEARLAHNPNELEEFLTPLADSGLDLIHASTRRFWQPEFEGSPLTLAAWTKKITGLPTISVGSVALEGAFDPRNGVRAESGKAGLDDLVQMIERKDFDIIAIGRSLLANPEWASIVREHGAEGLRPYYASAVDELY